MQPLQINDRVTIVTGAEFTILAVKSDLLIVKSADGSVTIINSDCVVTRQSPQLSLYNPRSALRITDGAIDVDLDMLDLNYIPAIDYPKWQPTTNVKPYEQLSKIYLDIETTGLDPQVDRVIMVGLRNELGVNVTISDEDESVILTKTLKFLTKKQPELIVGHNLFNFDLPFLIRRCTSCRVAHPFLTNNFTSRITSASMYGQAIEFTNITIKKWNCSILDTMQQVAIWDKQAANLDGYGLKNSTIALKLREERRVELTNNQIQAAWLDSDLEPIKEYLIYDLEDTEKLGDFLLPTVYYQLNYVPGLTFQELGVVSPAKKAQKIHEQLHPFDCELEADPKFSYEGGKVGMMSKGLHHNVAKIDVASLYPTVMLRYGIASRKDTGSKFLGVLEYMRSERLKLKALGKAGDKAAKFMDKSLKVLINGSYGFYATGYYTYNDFQAAALITAYGRKILDVMIATVEELQGVIISCDTDGIYFSSDIPDTIFDRVQAALPDGFEIELEMKNCGMYAPKDKSYIIIDDTGSIDIKGIFRKRNRYPLENIFPVEFIRLYFMDGENAANDYYETIKSSLAGGTYPIEQLSITRKIGAAEKKLVELGFGQAGDRVTYWTTEEVRYAKRATKATGEHKRLKSLPTYTQTIPPWIDFYLDRLNSQYCDIMNPASVEVEETDEPKD